MRRRICTFLGHRDTPETVAPILSQFIEKLIIEEHIEDFYFGGYGNFDCIAANTVHKLKQQYPNIRLYLIQAYLQTHKSISIDFYDGSIFPEGLEIIPKRFAISYRNRWMVQQADFIIGFIQRTSGGAYTAYHYAVHFGKRNVNLAGL